jgi:hypothetical protein
MPKVLVAIPAYNEEQSISGAVEGLRRRFPAFDCLVINDGSGDQTLALAKQAGAEVLDCADNLGIGGAMQCAFLYAAENSHDVLVQFDGDQQHPADRIPDLISALAVEKADIVIGSRFLSAMPGFKSTPLRLPGVKILSLLLSLLTGRPLTDTTSGFRAFSRRAILLFSDRYPRRYPEPESLLSASRQGFVIREIPVSMQPRKTGASSITWLTGFHYMFTVIMNIIVELLRRKE